MYDSNRNLCAPADSSPATTNAIASLVNVAEPKAEVREEVSDVESDDRFTEAMKRRVIALVTAEYNDAGLSQRAFAEQLHLSQPALNRLKKHGAGIGLDFVLALRTYFIEKGQPKTLDEILGLDATDQLVAAYDALEKRFDRLIDALRTIDTANDISAKKKKNVLAEASAARLLVGGNRGRIGKGG